MSTFLLQVSGDLCLFLLLMLLTMSSSLFFGKRISICFYKELNMYGLVEISYLCVFQSLTLMLTLQDLHLLFHPRHRGGPQVKFVGSHHQTLLLFHPIISLNLLYVEVKCLKPQQLPICHCCLIP